MKYTIDNLRGKYVKVGTPECEIFMNACDMLGIRWADGESARNKHQDEECISLNHHTTFLTFSDLSYYQHMSGLDLFVPHAAESSRSVDWGKAPKGAQAYNGLLQYKWLRKLNDQLEYHNDIKWITYNPQKIGVLHWRESIKLPNIDTSQRTAESSAVKTRKCHSLTCENMVEGNVGTYCGCNHSAVDNVDNTVTQRGERYGLFADGAVIMQDLKAVMRATPGWERLTPSQREALEMIQHKIGRVLNGDPMYDDSWRDISGYSTLILNELNGVKR